MYRTISTLQQQKHWPEPIRYSVRNSEHDRQVRILGEALAGRVRTIRAIALPPIVRTGFEFSAKNQRFPALTCRLPILISARDCRKTAIVRHFLPRCRFVHATFVLRRGIFPPVLVHLRNLGVERDSVTSHKPRSKRGKAGAALSPGWRGRLTSLSFRCLSSYLVFSASSRDMLAAGRLAK